MAGVDPLTMATSRETCDATAQSEGKPLFESLRAYVVAYEKGTKPPDVPNTTVVAKKTTTGAAVPY